jgi:hypothetical protein
MDIEKFVNYRPDLYHLTNPINLNSILSDFTLKSTTQLATLFRVPELEKYLRTRRTGHEQPIFSKDNLEFCPRDQDPLLDTRLKLEEGMTPEEYRYLLNSKVFFWARETDLEKHYKRYKKLGQNPSILRVSTADLFNANSIPPMFCYFNSGMTSHWTNGLPVRGRSSFTLADDYSRGPSSVTEVTFEGLCSLPDSLYLTTNINEAFKIINRRNLK